MKYETKNYDIKKIGINLVYIYLLYVIECQLYFLII